MCIGLEKQSQFQVIFAPVENLKQTTLTNVLLEIDLQLTCFKMRTNSLNNLAYLYFHSLHYHIS